MQLTLFMKNTFYHYSQDQFFCGNLKGLVELANLTVYISDNDKKKKVP